MKNEKEKMKEEKKYLMEVLKGVPSLIAIVFGGLLGVAVGGTAVLGQAIEFLSKKNKEWFEEYITQVDVISAIDDAQKSAENLQFIREVIQKVTFETREEKRKRFLNAAINYRSTKEFKFDEKMLYLNILDNLSETELICFLKCYDHNRSGLYTTPHSIKKLLESNGLLEIDQDSVKSAFEMIGDDIKVISEKLSSLKKGDVFSGFGNIDPKYNHSFNQPRFEFKETQLGNKFYNFITRNNDNKSPNVGKLTGY